MAKASEEVENAVASLMRCQGVTMKSYKNCFAVLILILIVSGEAFTQTGSNSNNRLEQARSKIPFWKQNAKPQSDGRSVYVEGYYEFSYYRTEKAGIIFVDINKYNQLVGDDYFINNFQAIMLLLSLRGIGPTRQPLPEGVKTWSVWYIPEDLNVWYTNVQLVTTNGGGTLMGFGFTDDSLQK